MAKRLIAAAGEVKTLPQPMTPPTPSPLARDVSAVLDWWREAGVDAAFSNAPNGWLKDPQQDTPEVGTPSTQPPLPQQPAEELQPIGGGSPDSWPHDLSAFRQWWLNEPSLDEGGLTPRVAPRGAEDAALMVLVDMPEECDRELLLSGRLGALLEGFLAAAGLDTSRIYRASALPRHQTLPDWQMLISQGLGAVIAHHVALARPRRLLVLGQSILPLCGHDPAQGAQNLRAFNHEGGRVPALAEAGLDRLLAKPQLRARLWRRWLEWTDGDQVDSSP